MASHLPPAARIPAILVLIVVRDAIGIPAATLEARGCGRKDPSACSDRRGRRTTGDADCVSPRVESAAGGLYTFSCIRHPEASAHTPPGTVAGGHRNCGGRSGRRGLRTDRDTAAVALRTLPLEATMERKTGAKNVNGQPHIESIDPVCALPGGEVRIIGTGLGPRELRRPEVSFGDVEGAVIIELRPIHCGACARWRCLRTGGGGLEWLAQQSGRSTGSGIDCGKPASGCEPGGRRTGKYLRNLLGAAGQEDSGRDPSHRYQP